MEDLKVVIEFREQFFKKSFLDRFNAKINGIDEWKIKKTIATKFHQSYSIKSIKDMEGNVLFEHDLKTSKI